MRYVGEWTKLALKELLTGNCRALPGVAPCDDGQAQSANCPNHRRELRKPSLVSQALISARHVGIKNLAGPTSTWTTAL